MTAEPFNIPPSEFRRMTWAQVQALLSHPGHDSEGRLKLLWDDAGEVPSDEERIRAAWEARGMSAAERDQMWAEYVEVECVVRRTLEDRCVPPEKIEAGIAAAWREARRIRPVMARA